jgi:hypothetical protein
MNELERLRLEEKLIDKAMNDTFRIITGKITLERYLIEKEKELDEDWALLFDGFNNTMPTIRTLDNMIDYFVSLEEYEKCAELVKYKKKHNLK